MPIAYVSDEYYAALAGVQMEFRTKGTPSKFWSCLSLASGTVECLELPPGDYEVCLTRAGYGSKRVNANLGGSAPVQFRLLSDRLLGYAWPKWTKSGDEVQFRVHAAAPYKLELWRYGLRKERVRSLGWFDNHGPRAATQTLPDCHFVERGVSWDNGFGIHRQLLKAPEPGGLYYFHAKTETGEFFSFPLVVAPTRPRARIAVLCSTNTWNAYNPFGGRSNYIMAGRMIDVPIVNAKADLPRYRLSNYGEWKSNETFEPLSFDRPEPYNHVPENAECIDSMPGRQSSHLAPAEWRLLGWLEREGFPCDLYADYQLHSGTLDLNAYRMLILGAHPEYWSAEMYQAVKKWVFERGGKLLYLGGNGLNCRVELLDNGSAMRCFNQWPAGFESRFHHQVESEANLLGVVYSDPGAFTSAPYEVLEPEHWVFAGTNLKRGDTFGTPTLHERCPDGASGHETDKITPSSPKNIALLARGQNPDNGGANLTLFDTPSGGAVFSAGSITYPAALLCDPLTSRITANVITGLLEEISDMAKRRHIEREFGVPIAGEILEPDLWTKTALKRLPADGPLDFVQLFGRQAPLVLDIGCGNGRFSLGSAVWRPDHDHIGIDILPVVIRYATRRGNQRGLKNLRFAVCDGQRFLRQYSPPHSWAEIHCYHPQPYYHPADVERRLITPDFLALVQRGLVAGGSFHVQTDNPGYWKYMRQVVPVFFDFQEQPGTWPDAPKGRTRREIIALRKGLPVFRGWGTAKPNLSEAESLRLAQSLPPPVFDADRRLRELDELETKTE